MCTGPNKLPPRRPPVNSIYSPPKPIPPPHQVSAAATSAVTLPGSSAHGGAVGVLSPSPALSSPVKGGGGDINGKDDDAVVAHLALVGGGGGGGGGGAGMDLSASPSLRTLGSAGHAASLLGLGVGGGASGGGACGHPGVGQSHSHHHPVAGGGVAVGGGSVAAAAQQLGEAIIAPLAGLTAVGRLAAVQVLRAAQDPEHVPLLLNTPPSPFAGKGC